MRVLRPLRVFSLLAGGGAVMMRESHVWALICLGLGCGAPRPAAVEPEPSQEPARSVARAEPADSGAPPALDAGSASARADRVRRPIPDGAFPATKATCREPARSFCRDGCASLSDFARTFDCHHVELERCGPYRALTVLRPLAGFIAIFDDDGRFVAGERWSDANDACDGTATTAYYGPPVRCAGSDEFVPWCGSP